MGGICFASLRVREIWRLDLSLIAPNIRSIVDHDGAVILDIENDAMLRLNSTGAYVWAKLRQGKSVDEIVRELAEESSADLVTVDHDVREFLDLLKARHLFRA